MMVPAILTGAGVQLVACKTPWPRVPYHCVPSGPHRVAVVSVSVVLLGWCRGGTKTLDLG